MDNALSPAVANAASMPVIEASSSTQAFVTRLQALPMRNKVLMGAGLAVLAAAVLAITLWSNQGDYRPLFTGLSDKDGGAVITQLAAMNVAYRNEPGGIIMVPASQVYDLRMKLASAGLPKGGVNGFELMDKSSIGQTQFSERLNFQRGLEGELVRTITAMSDVLDARVHLALPQQNGFFREQQKPSASVMLTLRGGHVLDRAQVAGIVHLVSSSVPELSPKAVSVVDQSGNLLSANTDNANGLDDQQLRYKQQVEANYIKRINELLEPVVGKDNLRSTVTADVDFNQIESTAEEYKPNQGRDANTSIRSAQTSEGNNTQPSMPSGIPGAATNQPPVPATAPINGASAPLQTAGGGGSGNNSSHKESTTNYELDKTVRVTRNSVGNVRRLNTAIVINYRPITDAKGKTTQEAVPQAELDKLDAIVREAMGFNTDRGDSLKIVSAPFVAEKPEADLPIWKNPAVLDVGRSLIVPLALVAVALIAVFGMVRPALRMVRVEKEEADAKAAGLSELVDDDVLLPGQLPALEGPVMNEKLERARTLARENPVAVANIMREWINGTTA
ncbi:MAG TPA: flagellar basal-body MS-ring/collar protein FliF [Burkholderiaceae bacterium]|jgi:flagellar M-ring protein FliF